MSIRPWFRSALTTTVAGLLICTGAAAAEAQEAADAVAARSPETVPPRAHWLGFRFDLGLEFPQGKANDVFQGSTRGEFSVLISPHCVYPVYFGFGLGLTSYATEPNINEDDLWNHFSFHAAVGYTFRNKIKFPLYLEARAVQRRLRPLDRRYWASLQGDDPPQERPYDQWDGAAIEGLAGVELDPFDRLSVDVAARVGTFAPSSAFLQDGTPLELGGWMFGLQAGLMWYP